MTLWRAQRIHYGIVITVAPVGNFRSDAGTLEE
jgi:hypothetical protein